MNSITRKGAVRRWPNASRACARNRGGTTSTLLTDAVLSEIGRSTAPRHGLVTADQIAKFCAAVDDRNPLYLDAAAARAAGHADVIAPPLFAAAATRPVPARSGLLADGQYDTLAPPGLTHLQTMLAGQHWEICRPAVAGERVIEEGTTRSITERQGATDPVVFVEKEAVIRSADRGDAIERSVATLILRDPPLPLPPVAGETATKGSAGAATSRLPDGSLVKRPDMITLFMFAATIWAVHRIHWDAPYARSEGLPAPVLPGWMLASYLAQRARGAAPEGKHLAGLAVRYRAIAHPDDILTCRATSEAEPELTITNQHETVVVNGKATFAR